ncbi:MAG: hypothetical protein SAK29_21060 [Scytonema sp. PMC 1069.18]|nr:hypothetical protein [Scytonema sp. PMC 1069.18]MEC4887830.1 hypothetical protein [Scytonema sp. PMC 1070.18]
MEIIVLAIALSENELIGESCETPTKPGILEILGFMPKGRLTHFNGFKL